MVTFDFKDSKSYKERLKEEIEKRIEREEKQNPA